MQKTLYNFWTLTYRTLAGALLYVIFFTGVVKAQNKPSPPAFGGYLFAYFTGNATADEAIHFAVSKDGYHFIALNRNIAVFDSKKISSSGGVRDPHILRGADGKTFYMVATDMVSAHGWNSNRAMVLMKSQDLIHWQTAVLNIQKRFSGQDSLLRVWAPQTIYDAVKQKYMIYWSMKYGKGPDQIYYAYANQDFSDLETKPELLFSSAGGKSTIDADIFYDKGLYHLFFKTEGNGNGIKQAVSEQLTGSYNQLEPYLQQTQSPVEGSGVFRLNDGSGYILMYDMYTSGKYQFTYSKDLNSFSVVDQDVYMNFHPRHGTIISLTGKELERLTAKWLYPADVLLTAQSAAIIKDQNQLDTAKMQVTFKVKPGTDLHNFDPGFLSVNSVVVTPNEAQDFSKGPVRYKVAVKGQKPAWITVSIQ